MAAPPIQLQLFGTFELSVQGVEVTGVPKPVQELIAHLALGGNRGVDRVETASGLWPDVEDERALFYLRRSLTQLRTALGSERHRLRSVGERRIVLDLTGCECDLTIFDTVSKRSEPKRLSAAVEAYGGKLLLGHQSEWVRQLRATYAERNARLLRELAAEAEESGDLEGARAWLSRAVQADPVGEETCRQLMRLLARGGDFAPIVRVFRDLRLSLRKEVGLPPSQATIDLYRELLAGARLVASVRVDVERATPAVSSPPTPATPFFERSIEEAALREALDARRLVTLTGHGGVGKTRLAMHVAQAVSGELGHSLAFVDMSVCAAPADAEEQITRALGLSDSTVQIEQIGRTLLVVDGAEAVVSGCVEVLGRLLKSASGLRILCTSRIALQMTEEHVILLEPMRLPSPQNEANGDSASVESVAYFLCCAERVAPAVRIEPRSLEQVVELCRRLDGLPLALELAAVRLRSLPLPDIVANLDNQMGLLDVERDGQDRRTLKKVLDWSFRLLSHDEATLFVRLGIFPSGWTVAEAKAICGSPGIDPEVVPMLLSGLVDHSLVVFDSATEGYRMLGTVKGYARGQLARTPGSQLELQERHADYYLQLAESIDAETMEKGPEESNFTAAIETFLGSNRLEQQTQSLRLVNRLFPRWYHLGTISGGLRTALRVIESVDNSPTELMAETLFRAAGAAHWLFRIDLAKELFGRAESIADTLDLEAWGTESIRSRGEIAANEGSLDESRELLSIALRRFRLAEDPLGEAACLGMLGYVARQSSQDDVAFELTESALGIYTALDNSQGRLWCLGSLAAAHMSAGSPERAVPILLETLELQEQSGNLLAQVWNLTMLGVAHIQLREYEASEAYLLRALSSRVLDTVDLRRGWILLELGELYRHASRSKEADTTLLEALKLCRESGSVSLEVRALLRLSLVSVDLGDLSSARAYRAAGHKLLVTLQNPPQMHEIEEIDTRLSGSESRV